MIDELIEDCTQGHRLPPAAVEDLKDYLNDNPFRPESLADLLEIFCHPNFARAADVHYLLFHHLRQGADQVDYDLMAAKLGETAASWRTILLAQPPHRARPQDGRLLHLTFPLAKASSEGAFVEALVVPLPGNEAPLSFGPAHRKDSLLVIQQAVAPLLSETFSPCPTCGAPRKVADPEVGGRFFVVFNQDFSGESYMLSVAAAMVLDQEVFETFSFTGRLDARGNIYSVGFLEEKASICSEHGRKMLDVRHMRDLSELLYWLGEGPLDLPILPLVGKVAQEVQRGLERLEAAIAKEQPYFNLNNLQELFGLRPEELTITHEEFLPPEQAYWENFLHHTVRPRLNRIITAIPGRRRVLHIGSSVVALSMSVGVFLGTKKPAVLYHYQDDLYHPVLRLSEGQLRSIKQVDLNPARLEHLKPPVVSPGAEYAIVIYLASHSPYAQVQKFLDEHPDLPEQMVKIERQGTQHGVLPLPPPDWSRYVQEMYSILNQVGQQRLHLFVSMPGALAMGLGMAMGHFFRGTIYNFNPREKDSSSAYYPVFSPGELASPF